MSVISDIHIVSYKAESFDQVVSQINALGYGLTLGLHSRLDGRAKQLPHAAKVGNIYINRNQIGAVVGIQPFGGEGLSGTGPKAGGPHYLTQFTQPAGRRQRPPKETALVSGKTHAAYDIAVELERVRKAQLRWADRFKFEERRILLLEAFQNCTRLHADFRKARGCDIHQE